MKEFGMESNGVANSTRWSYNERTQLLRLLDVCNFLKIKNEEKFLRSKKLEGNGERADRY